MKLVNMERGVQPAWVAMLRLRCLAWIKHAFRMGKLGAVFDCVDTIESVCVWTLAGRARGDGPDCHHTNACVIFVTGCVRYCFRIGGIFMNLPQTWACVSMVKCGCMVQGG